MYKSMGRWPTLGELIEYYSRDDIAEILYYQSKRWRILMNFGGNAFLEPTNPRDISDKIVTKLREFTGGLNEHERLDEYPTMHLLKDRGEEAEVRYDFMTEDDPRSWTEAFAKMSKALDVLDSHDVFYRIKFSGHRSLHLWIPAESLPRTFQGRSINAQSQRIEKRIKSYLPETGHVTVGFRVVYSTHPIGGMVSVPLQREELPCFHPWMANVHTVRVVDDWFQIPPDAVERNERFLHAIFDTDASRASVNVPDLQPQPVQAYADEPTSSESAILQGLDSEASQTRVAAARAALVQKMPLSERVMSTMFQDSDRDMLWFATEIALQQSAEIELNVDAILNLLRKDDDYVVGTGYDQFLHLTRKGTLLEEYLFEQREISPETAMAARLLAEIDWERFVELPRRISTSELESWFPHAWVICGSALCFNWRPLPDELYACAFDVLPTLRGTAEEKDRRQHELKQLQQLRRPQSIRHMNDALILTPATSLRSAGHDLRGLVMAMLEAPYSFINHIAYRILTQLWWEDCIHRLLQRLDASASRRKGALRALVDIGEPAIPSLIQTLENTHNTRVAIMCLEALGKIGVAVAIPTIQQHLDHSNERIRFNARRVLAHHFNIQVSAEETRNGIPDAEEREDH